MGPRNISALGLEAWGRISIYIYMYINEISSLGS